LHLDHLIFGLFGLRFGFGHLLGERGFFTLGFGEFFAGGLEVAFEGLELALDFGNGIAAAAGALAGAAWWGGRGLPPSGRGGSMVSGATLPMARLGELPESRATASAAFSRRRATMAGFHEGQRARMPSSALIAWL
jgi:hypothetical protein